MQGAGNNEQDAPPAPHPPLKLTFKEDGSHVNSGFNMAWCVLWEQSAQAAVETLKYGT